MMLRAVKVASVLHAPAVWIPLLMLAAVTALFCSTDLDLAVVRPFYSGAPPTADPVVRFPLMIVQPWRTLYVWG
jgi:hypothetical protein